VCHLLIRDRHPRQGTTRRAGLLAWLAPDTFACLGGGFFRPGRSSQDGGIEEFPLLRPAWRSRAVTRSTSRAFAAVSSSIALACAAIMRSRDAHEPHADIGGSSSDTAT
jgi:hypothetical protein